MTRPFSNDLVRLPGHPTSHAKRIALALSIAMGLISCASAVLLSGEDLVPQRRSEFRALTGIAFLRSDYEKVDGRWFIVKPGRHSIELISRRDSKVINPALEGMIKELTCAIEVDVRPGERIQISSRLRKGKPRFSKGFSSSSFHTEISLESSVEGRSGFVDTTKCMSRTDCKKVDRMRVFARSCDP